MELSKLIETAKNESLSRRPALADSFEQMVAHAVETVRNREKQLHAFAKGDAEKMNSMGKGREAMYTTSFTLLGISDDTSAGIVDAIIAESM